MAEKSKRQLKMEEYFKQNGIEYDNYFASWRFYSLMAVF